MARRSAIFRANLPRGWEWEGEEGGGGRESYEEEWGGRGGGVPGGKKRKPLLWNVKKQLLSRHNAA